LVDRNQNAKTRDAYHRTFSSEDLEALKDEAGNIAQGWGLLTVRSQKHLLWGEIEREADSKAKRRDLIRPKEVSKFDTNRSHMDMLEIRQPFLPATTTEGGLCHSV